MGLFGRQRVNEERSGKNEGSSPADGVQLFPPTDDSRFLHSFPGPEMVQDHFKSAIPASGLTFTLAGRQSPQAVLNEFLRLVPLFRKSHVHESGVAFALGDEYLAWGVLTDGAISMVLYPGIAPGPSESPRAREVYDAAFYNLRKCGHGFFHYALMSGEGSIPLVDWIEDATLVPVQTLAPWNA